MRVSGTRAAVTAAVAVGAFCVGALGTGIADGAPRPAAAQAKLPGTFQMYANVDQLGDLGSNVGATGVATVTATYQGYSWNYYEVTFARPIGSCAAQAQPGFAGGRLSAGQYSSDVIYLDSTTFRVFFHDTAANRSVSSAFMLTVTCQK